MADSATMLFLCQRNLPISRKWLVTGGWDDVTAPIESESLPVYRALAARAGADATILAYPAGHSLRPHRDRVADDIVAWLIKRVPPQRPGT